MFSQLSSQLRSLKFLSSVAVLIPIGSVVFSPSSVSAMSLTPVNTELSLLVDVSGSIDDAEYALQMGAYRNAFRNLAASFESGEFGSVAVNLIQWSGAGSQQESVGWTLINDQNSALQFANAIDSIQRPFYGSTAVGSAIDFAVPLFSSNQYKGKRWVMDVSGDGIQNDGLIPAITARDNALAAGVSAINGLPIITDGIQKSRVSSAITVGDNDFVNGLPIIPGGSGSTFSLEEWYRTNVQGGDDSFTVPAQGFNDIERALERKLIRELDPPPPTVPTPTNMLGILIAGGLSRLKRHRKDKEA